MRRLLQRNTEELAGVVTALGGGYVLPEAGGDLLRDGPGVLPTGDGLVFGIAGTCVDGHDSMLRGLQGPCQGRIQPYDLGKSVISGRSKS